MATPTIVDAMDALVARLQMINGAAPYTHNVSGAGQVELRGGIFALIPETQRPYIGVQLMGPNVAEAMSRQVFEVFDVRLVCQLPVEGVTARNLMVAQCELVDDIYTCFDQLPSRYTLGQTAYGLKILQWRCDANDPLAVGTVHVYLQMKISRSPGAS